MPPLKPLLPERFPVVAVYHLGHGLAGTMKRQLPRRSGIKWVTLMHGAACRQASQPTTSRSQPRCACRQVAKILPGSTMQGVQSQLAVPSQGHLHPAPQTALPPLFHLQLISFDTGTPNSQPGYQQPVHLLHSALCALRRPPCTALTAWDRTPPTSLGSRRSMVPSTCQFL
jgi:hypothetical protein